MLKSSLENIEEYYKLNCGRYLIFLDHPLQRYLERSGAVSGIAMKKEVIRIANDLATRILYQSQDQPGYYGVHSNSTGIGFVIDWRRDNVKTAIDDNNHMFMMTFFSIRKYHHFKSEDTVYIVQKILHDFVRNKPSIKNANQSFSRFVKDNLVYGAKDYKAEYYFQPSKLNSNDEVKVVFFADKLIENNLTEVYLV